MKARFLRPTQPRSRIITGDLPVLIDSREQRPYRFKGGKVVTLKTGDYSVEGYEDRVAVERKTLTDYLGCVGRDRARFERELERLARFEYAALVIEADLEDLRGPYELSKVKPAAAIGSLISFSIRYGVYVWLAGSREQGMGMTYRLLQHFVRIAEEAK